MGDIEGTPVGDAVAGPCVGAAKGDTVGTCVGDNVGCAVGPQVPHLAEHMAAAPPSAHENVLARQKSGSLTP